MNVALNKPRVFKIFFYLLTDIFTTMYDDAVCAIFPCFLGPNQIAILKIAILNARLFMGCATLEYAIAYLYDWVPSSQTEVECTCSVAAGYLHCRLHTFNA